MVAYTKITEVHELMRLVDNETNVSEGIDISKLYVNSPKQINWKCENGHSFREKVKVVFRRKNKCQYCAGRKVIRGENDLNHLFPEIASEWDYEKNGGVLPETVSPYSWHPYWWICPKGHSYKTKNLGLDLSGSKSQRKHGMILPMIFSM